MASKSLGWVRPALPAVLCPTQGSESQACPPRVMRPRLAPSTSRPYACSPASPPISAPLRAGRRRQRHPPRGRRLHLRRPCRRLQHQPVRRLRLPGQHRLPVQPVRRRGVPDGLVHAAGLRLHHDQRRVSLEVRPNLLQQAGADGALEAGQERRPPLGVRGAHSWDPLRRRQRRRREARVCSWVARHHLVHLPDRCGRARVSPSLVHCVLLLCRAADGKGLAGRLARGLWFEHASAHARAILHPPQRARSGHEAR